MPGLLLLPSVPTLMRGIIIRNLKLWGLSLQALTEQPARIRMYNKVTLAAGQALLGPVAARQDRLHLPCHTALD